MPTRKRCRTTAGINKENGCDVKSNVRRKKKDTPIKQRKTRGTHNVDSLISLAEPVYKKKKYVKANKSRGKSRCICKRKGVSVNRKDATKFHKISSARYSSESLDSVELNSNQNPLKYSNSVITICSTDSCDATRNDYTSRSKQNMSEYKLNNTDSQKYRAIAELEGYRFVTRNPGSTTEISFKPAVVMHVKKKTSIMSAEPESRKSDENIIVVNPSNDLLCNLSAGKVQCLYKPGATDLLRQAVENHSQSITNVLNLKSSMNFTNLESQRNISQQNSARNLSRQVPSSQLTQDDKCNVLAVKSSTNFTDLRFGRSSNLTVQTRNSRDKYQEILPPQPIQENSINSFAPLENGWRASQGHMTGGHGSVVCLSKGDSQARYAMGDRNSRTLNSRGSQKSMSNTSSHRR